MSQDAEDSGQVSGFKSKSTYRFKGAFEALNIYPLACIMVPHLKRMIGISKKLLFSICIQKGYKQEWMSIHPSIFCTNYRTQGHREPGAYSSGRRAQGSRRYITHHNYTHSHTYLDTADNLSYQSANNACLLTGGGNWSAQRKPPKHRILKPGGVRQMC